MAYHETAEDLNKKFGGTYCLLNGELITCHKIMEATDNPAVIIYQNSDKSKKVSQPVKPEQLEPINIKSGFYNIYNDGYADHARVFYKNAYRGTWNGYNSHTVSLKSYIGELLYEHGLSLRHFSITFETIQILLAHRWPKFEECFDQLGANSISAAPSLQFAVCLNPTRSPDHLLCSASGGFIGTIDRITRTITVRHKGSHQEVIDFVTRNNIKYRVILDA